MKFQLVSDLHLDFFRHEQQMYVPQQIVDYQQDEQADALIIAGDLAEIKDPVWTSAMFFLADHYEHVIYVLGNHEHYNARLIDVHNNLKTLPSNVIHLENETIELKGIRICGSTLWFPERKSKVKHQLNDFHAIPHLDDWVYQYHHNAIESIRSSNADLVITHHAPHTGSISLWYMGDALNPFFVVDCTDLIKELNPFVWVHGHCHDKCDYVVDNTRILSNPFGYPREIYYQVMQYPPVFFELTPSP